MSTIHTVIQSKSVGKTIAAMMLAHYLRDERGKTVLCLDTDTLNSSLSGLRNRPFEDCKVYQEHIRSVHSLVRMRDNVSTFLWDFERMLTRHLTFRETLRAYDSSIVTRSRILRIWNHMIEQLDCAAICD